MKLLVTKRFSLARSADDMETFELGVHDFSAADADHWMVKGCTEPFDPAADAEAAAIGEERDALKSANADLVSMLAAERAKTADLQALLDAAKNGKPAK